ncbi:DUF2381 family protein [Corallococcus praedator]|uniref:DUF2381 family protein n=2 Tax=Corallococcus praedator TaxID=2316724 RepID=A0ABX9QR58_9BACT|nr:DUF2381 family protein [Corallococcus sp. CA031C]RKH36365.1 DUF2381 family protein [Corallococcus sp. CA031C]RKI16581.1 DUF2381 family protein [Corallococcus praedator]
MPASPIAFLLVVMLASGAATAQPHPMASGLGVRHIEIPTESTEATPTPEVQISPRMSTTFEFDSALDPAKVVLEGEKRFSLVDLGRSTLRLVPSEQILPGERLRLTVRFQDGSVPLGAAFVLVAHPARTERVVEVWRQPRTAESYQQEAKEARAETQQFQEENARLRAEQKGPGGIAGLLANGVIEGEEGVDAKRLLVNTEVRQHPSNALRTLRAWSYRAPVRVAVAVQLENPDAEHPWTAEGASLVSRTGAPLKILTLWQKAPISRYPSGRVVVEAEATPDAALGPFTLKLWGSGGLRTITLSGVTFP